MAIEPKKNPAENGVKCPGGQSKDPTRAQGGEFKRRVTHESREPNEYPALLFPRTDPVLLTHDQYKADHGRLGRAAFW
jgi:hypothetical protein